MDDRTVCRESAGAASGISPTNCDTYTPLQVTSSDLQRAIAHAARDMQAKSDAITRVMKQFMESLNDTFTRLTQLAAELASLEDVAEASQRLRDAAEAQLGTACDKTMELLFVRLLWNVTETFDRLGHGIESAGRDGVAPSPNAGCVNAEPHSGFRQLSPLVSNWPIQPLVMMGMYHARGMIPHKAPKSCDGQLLRFPPPPGARFVSVAPNASPDDWGEVKRLMDEGAWVRLGGSFEAGTLDLGTPVDQLLTQLFCIPNAAHRQIRGSLHGRGGQPMKLPSGAFVVPLSHSVAGESKRYHRSPVPASAVGSERPADSTVVGSQSEAAIELHLDDLLAAFDASAAVGPPGSVPVPAPVGLPDDHSSANQRDAASGLSRAGVVASSDLAVAEGRLKTHRAERTLRRPAEGPHPAQLVARTVENTTRDEDRPSSSDGEEVIPTADGPLSLPSQIVGYRHETEFAIRTRGSRKRRGQSSGRVAIGDVSRTDESCGERAVSSNFAVDRRESSRRGTATLSEFANQHERVLFQVSASVKSHNKQAAKEAIRQLGCRINSEPHYDPAATHLLVAGDSIERTEKFLSFRAAGKYIVSVSYVFDSLKHGDGRLLNETPYREPPERVLPPLKALPFTGWCVVLFALPHISRGIRTILLAGGCEAARVFTPPFHHAEEWEANDARAQEWLLSLDWCSVTHVLVEVHMPPPDAPAGFSPTVAGHVPASVAALDDVSNKATRRFNLLRTVLPQKEQALLSRVSDTRPDFFSLEHLFQILCVPSHEQVLIRSAPIRYPALEEVCPLEEPTE
uniref:BRCT domain-containing protein n=1 Tax=Neobodo designis TaxID=312471 RepID=A0A7S1PYP0_NEODS|mmetsp:Transcript_26568/g.82120  ORF Transcript_26568/g.82120 Transcript_26568/m.82120 type:complete len:797 (+) Transcript_26568:33-2423(+)